MLNRGHALYGFVVLVGLQCIGAGAAFAQDWRVELDCVEATTAYKGTAHGTLTTNGRNSKGEFVLSGELDVSIREWDGEPRFDHVEVEGTIWKDGGMGMAQVQSASALAVTEVWFQPKDDWGSNVRISFPSAPSGERDYAMDCSASRLYLPQFSNLVISRDRNYAIALPDAPGSLYLNNYLFVTNDGNQPITPGPIRVRVAGREISSQLIPWGSGASDIPPDFSGLVKLNFAPGGVMQRCQTYEVELDLDRVRQSGPPPGTDPTGIFNPFNDDSGTAASPCLTWTTPIDFFTLGAPVASLINYVTLQEVVSSDVVARPDGKRCSECHFPASGRRYKPPAGVITSTREIVGKSWAQPGGWAQGFIAQDGEPGEQNKPEFLRQAFQRWLNDGRR